MLIRQSRQILEMVRANEEGLLTIPDGCHGLEICVSKTALRRALRIMDTLLKTLEACGYKIELAKGVTLIVVGEERMRLRLSEKVYRREAEPMPVGKSARRTGAIMYRSPWVFTATGILVLTIGEYDRTGYKKWTDVGGKPLEDQLNEVIAELLRSAKSLRRQRLEREARHREYEEQRRRQVDAVRRQREEEERRSALEQQAQLWLKSQQLRTFIAECERVLVEQHGEVRVLWELP